MENQALNRIFELLGPGTQDFFMRTWGENTWWDILISVGIFLVGILLARLLYKLFGGLMRRITGRTATKLDDILVDRLEQPLVLGLVIIFSWWSLERLHFADGPQTFINNIFHVLIAIDITWFVVRIVDAAISEYVMPMVEKSESTLDDTILPILRKGLRAILWIVGIIVGLSNAGYNVGALLAGAGIGGIAMAMAAKDFVANIFGGITVFLDKPFSAGDRIVINSYDGFVREIGIRSTKMERLDGRMVTIPNYKFTDSEVINVSSEPSRRVKMTLGLTYDTSADRIEEAIEILNGLVRDIDTIEDNHYAVFESFGDFSLNILFIYYVKKDQDVLNIPGHINFEILKAFNAAGLDFAFPTQTIIPQTDAS